jgi:hypothetical protein
MPGMGRNGKIMVAGVGKQRFDDRRTKKRCRVGKKKQKDPPPLSEKCLRDHSSASPAQKETSKQYGKMD